MSTAVHTCHAHGCTCPVPPRMFTCRTHWKQLPLAYQRLIWLVYREGQEIDKRPSLTYLIVQQRCVLELARIERHRDVPLLEQQYATRIRNFIDVLLDPGQQDAVLSAAVVLLQHPDYFNDQKLIMAWTNEFMPRVRVCCTSSVDGPI